MTGATGATEERPAHIPELLTPGEVARMMRVDPKTVGRWVSSGRLQATRTPGGHRRIRTEDAIEMIMEGGATLAETYELIALHVRS